MPFPAAGHIATAKRESLSHNKGSSYARPPFLGKDTRLTSRKKSHESRRYPRLWPLEEPTLFPRRWVSLTSRIVFAKSFTIDSFCEDIVSEEHRAWNSGFKEGLSCSRRKKKKTDNSLVALPNKATTSTLLVGALKSDILISVPAFFKVAKLDFWRAYCIFANRRSVFLFNALRNCQISGLTRGKDISTQLSEGSYFAKRFETSSWSSFLFQRLLAISANCLLMGGLFFSSSLKVAVKHFSLVFVRSRSPHFRSQASTESRPRGRVSRLPNPCEMSLSLLFQERSNRFGAFFDPSCRWAM